MSEKNDSIQYVKLAVDALSSKKGEDIRVLDIRNVSVISDYFVIATGANPPQIEAMKDEVDETLGRAGLTLHQIEGNRNSSWILMDYGEIIVHIFSRDDRLFYNLERIWGDGKEVDIESLV